MKYLVNTHRATGPFILTWLGLSLTAWLVYITLNIPNLDGQRSVEYAARPLAAVPLCLIATVWMAFGALGLWNSRHSLRTALRPRLATLIFTLLVFAFAGFGNLVGIPITGGIVLVVAILIEQLDGLVVAILLTSLVLSYGMAAVILAATASLWPRLGLLLMVIVSCAAMGILVTGIQGLVLH